MLNLFGKKPTVEGTFVRLCYVVSLLVIFYSKELQVQVVNRCQYLIFFLYYVLWPTISERQRETDRSLKKVGRDIERDRNGLEREEKKLVRLKIYCI
jgi:hypothetical protein